MQDVSIPPQAILSLLCSLLAYSLPYSSHLNRQDTTRYKEVPLKHARAPASHRRSYSSYRPTHLLRATTQYTSHSPRRPSPPFTAPARGLRQVPEPEPTPAPLTRLVGAAWPSLITKRGRIVSTLCSCIEKQPTLTTTIGFLVQKPFCFDSTYFVPVHRVPCHDNEIS